MIPVTGPALSHGTVAVVGARIVYVGDRRGAPAGTDRDLGDVILLPGLVNAHTHLELTMFRGLLEELPFRGWVTTLQMAKTAVLTREAMLDAARLGLIEGVRAGITTYADTSDSGVSLQAMRELGVRGVVYQEVFGPAPDQCADALATLQQKVDVLRSLEGPLHRVGVSPHAPYTVSDDLFVAVAQYARREALPVAVHIAESEVETRLVVYGDGAFANGLRQRGIAVVPRARSPVALLDRLGVLAAHPLLIHGVHMDAHDIDIMVRAGCSVAHCPISNAKLGHGIAPVVEWMAAGLAVGLGSDSMASNNRMDLLEEARAASLAQRARLRRPDILPAAQVLALATLGGARALGLADRVGSLEPGKDADLAAFPLNDPAATPVYEPATSLVFALAGRPACFVSVAGRVLVEDGRLLVGDQATAARVTRTAAALSDWHARHRLTGL